MSQRDLLSLLNEFGSRMPTGLAFELTGKKTLPKNHQLSGEIEAALAGETASLPYVRNSDVLWVTVAPTADALRRAIEDLRCWILPSYGWETTPAVIVEASGAGQMGSLILEQSPNGYFRWFSRRSDLETVIARLAMMRSVIKSAPVRETQLRQTLESLRRQFALGLATGDRDLALQAIDEIDQRQLDTAPNALGMRIRLAAAFGDDEAIVTEPMLDTLLSMQVPRRVVESVLHAHHAVYLEASETVGDFASARDAYRGISDRLAGLANPPALGADPVLVSMAAYQAGVDEDLHQLERIAAQFPANTVAPKLAEMFAAMPKGTEANQTVDSAESGDQSGCQGTLESVEPDADTSDDVEPQAGEGPIEVAIISPTIADWSEVPAALIAGEGERLNAFLSRATLDPDSCDPEAGNFLFEIFTDEAILNDAAKSLQVDQILTVVIDGYVCETLFPRRDRLELYQSVLEVWSSNRSQSTDPVDGQLLLTISDALLRLDGTLEAAVGIAIARWWEARPVRSRLAWLGEALELLTDQSISREYLTLWYGGTSLIRLDRVSMSHSDLYNWLRLGRRLGLDEGTITEALGGLPTVQTAESDPLSRSDLKKIAIVSLHERAAREAATQIEARSGAHVIVVTDHAAGDGTASAATADVILFVWGATKHAVYRAFDKVRDRLEYVQGTGSSSIVRALERRLTKEDQIAILN